MLIKSYIRFSFLFASLFILFIKKLKKGLQLYIDFRKLNTIIKKNYYLLLLIRETINNFFWAKKFIKLNIIITFNKLKMALKKEWKIMFYIHKGLFKYYIMLFGLYNALVN